MVTGSPGSIGPGVTGLDPGMRVGVPWLGGVCGTCAYCTSGRENLCREARFTGCHRDGGYAEYAVADARFAFPLPDAYDDVHAAPLLCAGLIGHRAYRMAGAGRRLGIYGHIDASQVPEIRKQAGAYYATNFTVVEER